MAELSAAAAAVGFRQATESDALYIGVLATQVFLDTYATGGIRPALANEALEHFSTVAIAGLLADPAAAFIVAEALGHMIGFAQMQLDAPQPLAPPGTTVELRRLYLQRRFIGRGIGKALLGRAHEWAEARGATSIWLTTWVGNERARAFYPGQSYRDAGASVYRFGGDEYENRVFVRDLRGPAAT